MTTINPVQQQRLWPCKWGWCRDNYTAKDDLVRHVLTAHVATAKKVKVKDIPLIIRAEQGIGDTASFIPSILDSSATQYTTDVQSSLPEPPTESNILRTPPLRHTTSSSASSPPSVPTKPAVLTGTPQAQSPSNASSTEAARRLSSSPSDTSPSSPQESLNSAQDVEQQLTQPSDDQGFSPNPSSSPLPEQASSPLNRAASNSPPQPAFRRYHSGAMHVSRPSSPAAVAPADTAAGVHVGEDVHMIDDHERPNNPADEAETAGSLASQRHHSAQPPNPSPPSRSKSPNGSTRHQDRRRLAIHSTTPITSQDQTETGQRSMSTGESQMQTNGSNGYSGTLQLRTQAPFSSQSSADGSPLF